MILKKWSLAAFALALVAPLSASALGLSIVGVSSSGASTSLLEDGDVVTIDLVLENNTQEDVFGLGLGVYGYDRGAQGFASDNRLLFAGGASSSSVLNDFADPGNPLNVFGGISNVLSGPVQQGSPGPLPPPSTLRVLMFNGVDTTSSNGTGALDIGVNGAPVGSGLDHHFSVSFIAQALALPGQVVLDFGVGGPNGQNQAIGAGGAVLPFTNASLTLNVVPEPGTALLMGLGLAGLAARRR